MTIQPEQKREGRIIAAVAGLAMLLFASAVYFMPHEPENPNCTKAICHGCEIPRP